MRQYEITHSSLTYNDVMMYLHNIYPSELIYNIKNIFHIFIHHINKSQQFVKKRLFDEYLIYFY